MMIRRFPSIACVLLILPVLSSHVHAQSEQWLIDLVEENKRLEAQRRANQPTTSTSSTVAAPQEDWGKLISILGETGRRAGESDEQRQQRMKGLADDLMEMNQDYKDQTRAYEEAKRQSYAAPTGGAVDDSYEARRRARLNPGSAAELAAPAASTAPAAPTAASKPLPAGFGKGYAGGFEEAPASTGSTGSGGGGQGRGLDGLLAAEVEEVDPGETVYMCDCRGTHKLQWGYLCAPPGYYYEIPPDEDFDSGLVYVSEPFECTAEQSAAGRTRWETVP